MSDSSLAKVRSIKRADEGDSIPTPEGWMALEFADCRISVDTEIDYSRQIPQSHTEVTIETDRSLVEMTDGRTRNFIPPIRALLLIKDGRP